MATTKHETIILMGDPLIKEANADVAIKPGQFVVWGAKGVKLSPVATQSEVANRKAIALENDLVGKGVDDAYAVNDRVRYAVFCTGSEAMVLVKAGSSAIVIGDTLRTESGYAEKVAQSGEHSNAVGFALEAVPAAPAKDVFIKMEVA